MTFFVSSSGFKVCKPVAFGKSKNPRCFRKLPNFSKPYAMQYFHSKKAGMTTEIKIQVLTTLNRKLNVENRKVLLFLDNAPSQIIQRVDLLQCIEVVGNGAPQRILLKAQGKIFLSFLCTLFLHIFDT